MIHRKIFICGGGTGGHFFSGIALAEKLLDLYPLSQIVFVGTRRGIEAKTSLPDPRMKIQFIAAKGLLGKGLGSKILGLLFLSWGVFQSFWMLLSWRPHLVFGVGGYASAPTLFAALLLRPFLRFHVCLLEQNSSPGVSNEVLRKCGAKAFSGFEIPGYEVVDLPLRKKMEAASQNARPFCWPPQTVLIMGGSQGARGLNAGAMDVVREWLKEVPSLQVFHQTGKNDEPTVRDYYKTLGLVAEVFSFSTEMELYYNRADLLICRAGAMTVFEVMAFGRPVIFVPFPAAAQDHQYRNAQSVQDRAWILREDIFDWVHVRPLIHRVAPSLLSRRDGRNYRSWAQILKDILG